MHSARQSYRIFLIATIFDFAMLAAGIGDTGDEWRVTKGQHFLVYHRGDVALAETMLNAAESAYTRIAADLELVRRDDFWLWEKRVRILIYPTRDEFIETSRAQEWSAGRANYKKREISTFAGSSEFVESVLNHEVAHLIIRDLIASSDTDIEIPAWLNEGIAIWEQSPEKREQRRTMSHLTSSGHALPLSELVVADIRRETNRQKVADFYAQSAALVGFLLQEYGGERFRKFLGQVADGKELEEALRFTYPDTIRSITDLERLFTSDALEFR